MRWCSKRDEVKVFKRVLFWLWTAAILVVLSLYLFKPDLFSAEHLRSSFEQYSGHLLVIYSVGSLVRGLALLPSTPFVLAGGLLFPQSPWLVLFISMSAILGSAAFVYLLADFLDVDMFLRDRFASRFEKLKGQMHAHGFWIVAAWSFFPAVPTDLICYAAGVVRLNFLKFMAGVFVGEVFLVAIYIWSGKAISEFLWSILARTP
jgi:uncharacterized membrane protein YdjX (TVP38/TMEM64 family)